MKPGDFLLGVQDFFAVLLPGTIATWLVSHYLPTDWSRMLDLTATAETTQATRLAIFLGASYLLGHFVFMLGARLDTMYDRWRIQNKPPDRDRPFAQATELRKNVTKNLVGEGFSTLKWARAYIQIRCPGARVEIDLLEATSKLFRGMVVISIALALHFLLIERMLLLAIASAVLARLSFQRFCDLRWKLSELSYATAVIVDAVGDKQSTPKEMGKD
jgi:hypothetical protein